MFYEIENKYYKTNLKIQLIIFKFYVIGNIVYIINCRYNNRL